MIIVKLWTLLVKYWVSITTIIIAFIVKQLILLIEQQPFNLVFHRHELD